MKINEIENGLILEDVNDLMPGTYLNVTNASDGQG